MVSSSFMPSQAESFEVNPSVRTSTSVWTKYVPIDVTLATAGTAQNLYAVSSANIASVNLATNPSFETGDPPTGYTAAGSAISQSAVVARTATNSVLVNPANLAAGEGFYWTTPDIGAAGQDNSNRHFIVASAYFNDNAGSGDDARIEIRDITGATTHASGNTVTLAAAWNRSTTQFALPITPAAYRVYFVTVSQHNTNFYVDDFQFEIRQGGDATDYFDGASNQNTEWIGTAHASESRRRKGLFLIRGFSLHFSRDTYIAFDTTASSTTGAFIRAGSDWTPEHPLHIATNLSFINVNTGELPRVTGMLHGVHTANPTA